MSENKKDNFENEEILDETLEKESSSTSENDDVNDAKEDVSENAEDDNVSEEDNQISETDEKIAALEAEAKENEEKYLRLYAEFENYKRRIQKENETNSKYQAQGVLNDILPALDNIDRALAIEGEDESFISLKKGVRMVKDSLMTSLENNGLEVIETEGQQFDPNLHQAVMQDNNPDFESGQITAELQRGYKLKDRVLRPSMVKVNE